MTELGKMKVFLGVEVYQSKDEIHLCQKKYAKEVLERFTCGTVIPSKFPLFPVLLFQRKEATKLMQRCTNS
jgi:hypothetical protein